MGILITTPEFRAKNRAGKKGTVITNGIMMTHYPYVFQMDTGGSYAITQYGDFYEDGCPNDGDIVERIEPNQNLTIKDGMNCLNKWFDIGTVKRNPDTTEPDFPFVFTIWHNGHSYPITNKGKRLLSGDHHDDDLIEVIETPYFQR